MLPPQTTPHHAPTQAHHRVWWCSSEMSPHPWKCPCCEEGIWKMQKEAATWQFSYSEQQKNSNTPYKKKNKHPKQTNKNPQTKQDKNKASKQNSPSRATKTFSCCWSVQLPSKEWPWAVPGQCWLEAAPEVSGTGWARVAPPWAAWGGLQEPRALQGGQSLAPHREAGQAAEEGEPQDNQTGSHWKGNRRAGKGRCWLWPAGWSLGRERKDILVLPFPAKYPVWFQM